MMAHDTLDSVDELPDVGVAVHLNRIACLWFSDELNERELPQQDRWRTTRGPRSDILSDVQCLAYSQHRPTPEVGVAYYDPAAAALAVLVGPSNEARFHSYWTQHLTRRLDAFEQEFEERIERLVNERVELALSEREQARQRADGVFQNVLAQLREKAKGVQLPPPEEAWKMINLLAPDDEDEED